jgi:hypothetical protein
MKVLVALAMLATPLAAADVPSGQPVTLHEVLVDAQDTTTYLRFRFIAPQIGKDVDFDVAGPDMMHLCQNVALGYMTDYALEGDKIVISFMDRITEFGVPDPDAVQYFEAFKPKNDTCMWDDF